MPNNAYINIIHSENSSIGFLVNWFPLNLAKFIPRLKGSREAVGYKIARGWYKTMICSTNHWWLTDEWSVPPLILLSFTKFTHLSLICTWNIIPLPLPTPLGQSQHFAGRLPNTLRQSCPKTGSFLVSSRLHLFFIALQITFDRCHKFVQFRACF